MAHHLFETVAGVPALAQEGHLLAQLLLLQGLRHQQQDLLKLEGLVDIVESPQLDGLDHRGRIPVGGHHDDHRLRRHPLQRLQNLHAAEIR